MGLNDWQGSTSGFGPCQATTERQKNTENRTHARGMPPCKPGTDAITACSAGHGVMTSTAPAAGGLPRRSMQICSRTNRPFGSGTWRGSTLDTYLISSIPAPLAVPCADSVSDLPPEQTLSPWRSPEQTISKIEAAPTSNASTCFLPSAMPVKGFGDQLLHAKGATQRQALGHKHEQDDRDLHEFPRDLCRDIFWRFALPLPACGKECQKQQKH